MTSTDPDADRLISAKSTLSRFEPKPNIRTLDRWLSDPRVGFPRPIVIQNRRYFLEREISDFIARKARERVTFKA
ncbi:hypothetical protein [Nitrobacter winogradskyi]|uniref:Uncharacterized protein n=2 Tax=Nitrobacter winogradskyi TaxID=913 RepID=A0A4Y3WBS5_NITWI|nr:hypothetical protein [Nitrobacter winogradskyi]MCP1998979.1 putative DNA-binding transcriptional regulator AlpA [Nitrobacter winogradskyi]GEC16502.1 hypothetical protein NWI01_23940 [Nitrobacter winogradskyi]